MKIIGIIPSRYHSKRMIGKPLYKIDGKSLLLRVYEQSQKAKEIKDIYIITDDKRIYNHALTFTNNILLSEENHETGTSRSIEAFKQITRKEDFDGFINIQGDEPLIAPELIDVIAKNISSDHIITAISECSDIKEFLNPNTVKVVCNAYHDALYFSRSPIPHGAIQFYKHIGIYGFHKTLIDKISITRDYSSSSENLEQLQWLNNGLKIKALTTTHISKGVDTIDDVDKILQMLNVMNV